MYGNERMKARVHRTVPQIMCGIGNVKEIKKGNGYRTLIHIMCGIGSITCYCNKCNAWSVKMYFWS